MEVEEWEVVLPARWSLAFKHPLPLLDGKAHILRQIALYTTEFECTIIQRVPPSAPGDVLRTDAVPLWIAARRSGLGKRSHSAETSSHCCTS